MWRVGRSTHAQKLSLFPFHRSLVSCTAIRKRDRALRSCNCRASFSITATISCSVRCVLVVLFVVVFFIAPH